MDHVVVHHRVLSAVQSMAVSPLSLGLVITFTLPRWALGVAASGMSMMRRLFVTQGRATGQSAGWLVDATFLGLAVRRMQHPTTA